MSRRRRTQEERRTETIGKLLEATVDCLAERGYASTSTNKIATRAGVSQGALFNHFDSRVEVIVAATDLICSQHIEQFHRAAQFAEETDDDIIAGLVEFVRSTARTPRHAAWHEVMVAARTDEELCEGVRGSLERFERGLLETAREIFSFPEERARRLGTIILSVMHMFDSEAVTFAVRPNPEIEDERAAWVAEILRRELAG